MDLLSVTRHWNSDWRLRGLEVVRSTYMMKSQSNLSDAECSDAMTDGMIYIGGL
jgi:hypothetical protein